MPNRNHLAVLLMGGIFLTSLIVLGVGYWFYHPTVLTIAVGPVGSPEQVFATKLASLLEQNRASIRLAPMVSSSRAQVVTRFAKREADLAILRTDAKIPAHGRAVAVLEHEMLLLLAGHGGRIKTLAELKGKKLAVLAEDGRNEAMVRRILDFYDAGGAKTRVQSVDAATPIDQLLQPGGYDFVVTFEPLSRIAATKTFETLADRMKGFTLYGVDEAKALQRKIPGLTAEPVEAGLLSGAPRIPDEDINTVVLQELLVARAKLSDSSVVELMRVLFENKAELSLEQTFATRIEPPDVEKDSPIAAHGAAAQYMDDNVKGFFDRYDDALYLTMSVGSVIGSLGLALFTSLTRVRPRKAGERSAEIMEVGEKIRAAQSLGELEIVETELEDALKEVLRGLKDGTMSSDGLDGFRLGYEHARDALGHRRRLLSAHAGEATG
jgi:TRAP-type uncharacterized transport system substrate-binding protein